MHGECFFLNGEYIAKCLMRCQNWGLDTAFCNFTPILHIFFVEKMKGSSCYCIDAEAFSTLINGICLHMEEIRVTAAAVSLDGRGVGGVRNHIALESCKSTGGHHPWRDKVHRFL